MYYLGFLKDNIYDVVLFKSTKIPSKKDYSYFVKVIGPYATEAKAQIAMYSLKREGYKENLIKGLVTKEGIRKSIGLMRKVKILYGKIRKKNPGVKYHDQKFLFYMRELEKYVVGSAPYIQILAKAYAHLQSAKDSRG